jgi:CelD/BcsL family acetyltransferase involved in cellulose biosynthesis
MNVSDTGASAYLLTDSETAALGAVSRSFRHNLRRLARRAEASAPLRLDICRTPEALAPALDRFLALEASGWKGKGGRGSAIAEHPRLTAFYRALADAFGARGECVIALLHHGGRPVAAHFGLIAAGRYNILKIAYSEADAAIAPGNLLMERVISWCCEQRDIGELSFVTGPAWCERWKPHFDPVRTYRLFAPTLAGRLLQGALRVKRGLRAMRVKGNRG